VNLDSLRSGPGAWAACLLIFDRSSGVKIRIDVDRGHHERCVAAIDVLNEACFAMWLSGAVS
jgi:hypothetical protein